MTTCLVSKLCVFLECYNAILTYVAWMSMIVFHGYHDHCHQCCQSCTTLLMHDIKIITSLDYVRNAIINGIVTPVHADQVSLLLITYASVGISYYAT